MAFLITCFTVTLGYVAGEKIVYFLAGSELSEEAIRNGLLYFYYLLPGLGLFIIGFVFIGTLQGQGLTKHIAIISIIAAVSNIILDPVLIFTFNMGIKGAAIATTLSIYIAGIYVVFIFSIKKRSSVPVKWKIFHAKKRLIYEIVRIGFPDSLGILAISLSFMFLNNIVSSIGETAMNAWSLCSRTDQMVLFPAFAIAGATITMVGQNFGRNNLSRVRSIYRSNVISSIFLVFFLVVIYNLAAPVLFSAFSSVEEVVKLSVMQIRYLSLTYWGASVAIIASSVFQATGRPMPVLIIRISQMGIISVPLAYFFVYFIDMGIMGVFLGVALGNVFMLLLSWTWIANHLNKLSRQYKLEYTGHAK